MYRYVIFLLFVVSLIYYKYTEGIRMTNQKVIHNFSEGNIPKQLIMFASPLFLSSLMQIVYNAVDMIVVGQKL